MKKSLLVFIRILCINFCLTAIIIPQTLQTQPEIMGNREGKWNLDRPYYSTFDSEKIIVLYSCSR
jgi:hypothetical protein